MYLHQYEFDVGALFMRVWQAVQQPSTPAPNTTVVTEFSNAAQTIGVVGVIAIIAMLIFLIAVGGFFVGMYRIGKPLVDNISIANKRADDAAAELVRTTEANRIADARKLEIQEKTAAALDSVAGTGERTANILNGLETKQDAIEGRQSAVEAINTHTSEAITPVKEVADTTLASVKSIEEKVDKLMTREEFTEQLRPVRDDIAELRRTIEVRLLPTLAPVVNVNGDTPPPVSETPTL